MVRMVTRVLVAMLVLSSVLAAVAQDNPAPGGPPGGGRGGFGRGGGMISRMIGGSLDDLQKELNLTPEQKEKINGIIDQTGETVRAKFEQARNGGDWGAMRTEMEKITNEAIDKVKGTLNPEQTEKFTKFVDERRNRMDSIGRGDRGGSPEQRVSRAMESLKIADATEAEAVKSLVAKIVKLQGDIMTSDRTAREKAGEILKSEGMADDALEARLKEFRTQRKALDDQLLQAQEELRKVVSARQEVELFRQSLLR
jgi:Spy/CpxP family protein refolding chaperone